MERCRMLGFIAATLLATGSAAAQEIEPVDVEVVNSFAVQPQPDRPERTAAPSAIGRRRDVPFLTPVSRADYAALKARAARDPRIASPADQRVTPSAPRPQIAAQVTTSFFGTNILQAENNGFLAVPPDPQVAASPSRVIEVVNSSIRARTRNGNLVQTMGLNDFFGLPPTNIFDRTLFDPKIIYDPNAVNKRFYVLALQASFPNPNLPRSSFIFLAVSRSPDPANLNPANWCFYRFEGRRDRNTPLVSWADFPGLGAGADALVITTNQFSFDGFFTFAVIRALNKLALSANAGGCPNGLRLFTFQPSADPGDPEAFTIQPVQHLTNPSSFSGTTNPVYLVNRPFPSVPRRDYRVYRLRNIATSPTLSFTTVAGNFAYFFPPNVPQENPDGFLDTGDGALLEAAGVGDAFWTTHATACSFPIGGNVSCNRVFRVRVGQSAGGALQANIAQQTTFGSPNEFLFWPGIAANLNETVAVPFHFASPARTNNYALSTWWTIKALGESSFGPLQPLITGVCQQIVDRTGDYSGAETDPVDLKSFWLSGERAVPIPPLGDLCLWATRIIRVTPAR